MHKYLMEFIGTMFLVLAVGLTGNALAIGLMLAVMIYMGGHISGAHYNPAVTLAIVMRGKMEAKDVVPYMAVQIGGALVAALICAFLGKGFVPAPAASASIGQSLLVEILFTFALASVILAVATSKALDGNYIYGLAIGLTVTASAFAGGGISGGAFNPAVGLGPIILDVINGGSSLGHAWLYIVGPFAGGALAAILYKVLNPDE